MRTQIEELPMLPEFPSAAGISEYVCDLEYLFSRMNVGSYEKYVLELCPRYFDVFLQVL